MIQDAKLLLNMTMEAKVMLVMLEVAQTTLTTLDNGQF